MKSAYSIQNITIKINGNASEHNTYTGPVNVRVDSTRFSEYVLSFSPFQYFVKLCVIPF